MTKLQAILVDAGLDCRSYSGRAMYGKSCLGVTLDRGTSAGEMWAALVRAREGFTDAERDEVADALLDMRSDSMGRGEIVYFPDVPFEEDESAQECPECGTTTGVHLQDCDYAEEA